jgi:hypothetical protein
MGLHTTRAIVGFDIGNDLTVVKAAIVDTVATKQFVDEPH